MDRNLDIDNFERLLKERSDEFKMYPAKRVWYSIYNNIHPGRKWPSVATSIILITILLLVGYINTSNKKTSLLASANTVQSGKSISVNLLRAFSNPILVTTAADIQNPETVLSKNSTLATLNNFSGTTLKTKKSPASIFRSQSTQENMKYEITAGNTDLTKNNLQAISMAKNNLSDIQPIINLPGNLLNTTRINNLINEPEIKDGSTLIALADLNKINTAINTVTKDAVPVKESVVPDEDKAWIENYALYNRPAPRKWAGKLRSQFYFTPSVVYRQLKNSLPAAQDINSVVIQHPSFGVEIGGGIVYPLLKGVNVKTGLQLNFTRYNANGFGNSHPVSTAITMVSGTGQPYPAFRSTPYSNNDGISPLQLHNETFQISLPVGLDLKILGSDNLQWNIGATIQPTYVVGGKSYLISSDKRNYIKETDLLNRWNLNAGFETFISYKTNGFTLQFGPQFRKQLFTTNSKQYSIEEKLTNYGLKFGISKLIK